MRRITFTIHAETDEAAKRFSDAIDEAVEKIFKDHPNVAYLTRYEKSPDPTSENKP